MKGLGSTHPDPAGEKTLPNGAKGKNIIDLSTSISIFEFEKMIIPQLSMFVYLGLR